MGTEEINNNLQPVSPVIEPDSGGKHAAKVGAGIFLSRIAGLIRDRVVAHYFGISDASDVFRAVLRIPNLLQNLFGEGVLSASFIPVYAKLLAKGEEEEADRVASAVFCLLSLVLSLLVLAGIFATPIFVDAIAWGFKGAKRELTISLVRIMFPGVALLVLSAWCLGILNSHRRFFLSYTAPVAWNAAMIAVLIGFGNRLGQTQLLRMLIWGSVAGSILQIGVQLPRVIRLIHRFRMTLGWKTENIRTVIRNFVPVFISRGVVQISAYVDTLLASLLPSGALAALSNAQTLYTLPVSLFGMSVSAAELPALSSALGETNEIHAYLRKRLNTGLRRIALFVIPSAMAFLALGDIVAGAIYQTGQFTRKDSVYVWGILAGSAVGLLATTLGRLYAAAFYALKDTRTPVRYAIMRVVLTVVSGYFFAIHLPPLFGIDLRWGVVGLTISAGLCGWLEFVLLRNALEERIGRTDLPASFIIKLWMAAGVGTAVAWTVKLRMGANHPIPLAVVSLGLYGLVYFAMAGVFRVSEARELIHKAIRFVGRRQ